MTRWMLAMVAAVALFAAACGGDSDGDDTAPETSAVVADDGDDTTATTAAEAAEGTSAPKDDIQVSGDPNSEWCGLAASLQAQFDGVEADPFAFFSEEGMAMLNDALDQAVQVAPPEIRSDVALSRDSFAEIEALLQANDYDLLSIPQADFEAIDQSSQVAAADRIEAYNEQVCGIESDGTTSSGTEEPATDDGPSLGDSDAAVDAFVTGLTGALPITEEQARCLADELDFASLAANGNFDPNDPELLDQVFAVLGVCDISITDLAG